MPLPLLKFLATPLPALVAGKENLIIDFGPSTLEMLPPSLRLSDIPLQAEGGAKKQNDCLVDTNPAAANSNQIIIGSC